MPTKTILLTDASLELTYILMDLYKYSLFFKVFQIAAFVPRFTYLCRRSKAKSQLRTCAFNSINQGGKADLYQIHPEGSISISNL